MFAEVSTHEDLLIYSADVQAFTMVKGNGPDYGIFCAFLQKIVPGKLQDSPPYPLLQDIASLVFAGDRISFKLIESYPAQFARTYRDFLDTLLRYDKSIQKIACLVEKMTSNQRTIFSDFFLMCLADILSAYIEPEDPKVIITYFPPKIFSFTDKNYRRGIVPGLPFKKAGAKKGCP